MSNRTKRHIHQYHKVVIYGNKVWACALSDCTHYMPKHLEDLVMGKNTICWDCERPFPIDAIAAKLDKPLCYDCLEVRNARTAELDKPRKPTDLTDPELESYLKAFVK